MPCSLVVKECRCQHKTCPADLYVSLGMNITSFKPIPAFYSSLRLPYTATSLMNFCCIFAHGRQKSFITIHTTIFVHCFMMSVIFAVMSHLYVLNIKDVLAVTRSTASTFALCLQLSQGFNFGWFMPICTYYFSDIACICDKKEWTNLKIVLNIQRMIVTHSEIHLI